MMLRSLCLTLLALPLVATAAEPDPGLTGKAELGYLATSGNSTTSSLNAKLALGFEAAAWRHSLTAVAVRSSDSGVTTAERYQLGVKSDYKFNEFDYLFVTVNWEQDEFAGFSQRTSEAVGYGRRLIHTDAHHLEAEVGAGSRQTDPLIGPTERETILRLAGKYQWKFAEGASFDQSLTMEKGSSNTYTESVSAVAAKLVGALDLKVSYTIKNNSDVAPGLESTDTYTSVGVAYSF